MLGLGLGLTSEGSLRRATAAGGTWTPTDLGAKLAAWWNADDTTDGAVATWTARVSGTAATAAAGLQPISAAASFNSAYRGLTADGVDDCFVWTSFTGLPTGATAGEVWGVFSYSLPGSTAAQGSIFRYGAPAAGRGFQRVNISNVSRAQANDGSATLLTDTAIDLSGPHIYGAAFSGTTMTARIDGRDSNPASAVITTLATTATRGRIFAGIGTSAASFWPGVGRHFIITNGLLTTTASGERDKLEGWFAYDSGLQSVLPVGHPYKSARP